MLLDVMLQVYGLVLSGNEPLPEVMLTKFYVVITRAQWVQRK